MQRVARGYSIVEGPVWDASSETLYFADGFNGGVLALNAGGNITLAVPKRRCSGIALHAAGGLVMSGRNVGWKRGEESARLLELDPAWGMAYFNDLGTGIDGRIYVGSLDYDFSRPDHKSKPGYLHLIDLDGSARIVADGIGIANGVAVSPDGAVLYFNDTSKLLVRRYNVLANGDLAETAPLIDFTGYADGAAPDGIAVASDGSVWVALAHAGCVARIDAGGVERERIEVPGHHVASVCFGGKDLRTLYITTHCETDSGEPDGSVFKTEVSVPGAPVPVACVTLPQ